MLMHFVQLPLQIEVLSLFWLRVHPFFPVQQATTTNSCDGWKTNYYNFTSCQWIMKLFSEKFNSNYSLHRVVHVRASFLCSNFLPIPFENQFIFNLRLLRSLRHASSSMFVHVLILFQSTIRRPFIHIIIWNPVRVLYGPQWERNCIYWLQFIISNNES